MSWTLSNRAEQDLDDVWDYVYAFHGSVEAASTRVRSLVDAIERIAEFPAIGRARPEVGVGVRSFVAVSYIVLYRIAPNQGIEVLRITGQQDDVLDA